MTLALTTITTRIPAAESCPAPVSNAQRLILVTAETMSTSTAAIQLFDRSSANAPWRPSLSAMPAVVGLAGMAWGAGFQHLARAGEPLKVEGDYRTPAGIYRLGASFGFAPSGRSGYLHIGADTVCVNDTSSPAYNTVTSRAVVGPKVRAEKMSRVALYRRGIVIDYPTDRAAKAGSCIFIHVWREAGRGTEGCVALPEDAVGALQDLADEKTVIAILPRSALGRYAGCLPGNPDATSQ
jgi:L,D-peptidoglycan transpeptidase YkuD (ErfK/YbiS/YcfS/YnhG family)